MNVSISMKHIFTLLFVIFSLPALAQTPENAPAPADAVVAPVDVSALDIDLTRYYRYVNKKCEFSFQLPEAPQTSVIWGETEIPPIVDNLPKGGEIGEHVIYHRRSIDDSKFLHFDAYCLYPENMDLSTVTAGTLENKFKLQGVTLDLSNLKVKAQQVSDDFIAASMTGLAIGDNDEDITAYYYQAFKGPNSLLLIQTIYNAEQTVARSFNDYIRDSMIYELRKSPLDDDQAN